MAKIVSAGIFAVLFTLYACKDQGAMHAKLIRIITPKEMDEELIRNEHLLTDLYFTILIENPTDAGEVINVKNYGSSYSPGLRTFWIYYSGGLDSLELFSGSCEFCLSQQILKPSDSVLLTLAVKYSNVSSLLGSPDKVSDEIARVYATWNAIKYIDTDDRILFTIQSTNPRLIED